MNRKRAYQASLFFNTIIFVIEAYALTNRFLGYLPYSSDYFSKFNYTDLYTHFDITANLFLALASLIMIYADIKYLRNMKNYRRATNFAILMKLSGVILSMIVFIAAYAYYYPIVWKLSSEFLYNNLLEFHYTLWAFTVLPVLALLSFIFFDIDPKIKFIKSLYIFIPVLGYFGTIYALSYFGIIQCPYELLDPRNLSSSYANANLMGFIIAYVSIIVGSYAFGALVLLLRNHFAKNCEKIGEEFIADGVGDIPADLLDKTSRKEYKRNKKQAKIDIKNARREKKGKPPIKVKNKVKEESLEQSKEVKQDKVKNKKEKKNKKELKTA